jgi:glucosylceramidase
MMQPITRRTFGRNVVGLAATATAMLAQPRVLWGATADRQRPVSLWITSDAQRFAQVEAPKWGDVSGDSLRDIQITPEKRFQQVVGFGAAFTDASCYLFSKLSAADRSALMEDLFGAKGLRLSVGRTCVGASDYSRDVYSFDESAQPDPELKHFSIDHDKAYILPSLREARKLNPELFLFSTPWSPPGWMKAGGSMLGGSMRKEYMAAYAQYIVRFLQGYAADGVKIDAVTVQNEVDTDQNGRMPAALWGQEYEMEFVKTHLGPALRDASMDTKIWVLDHNYNLWGRAIDELADPEVNKFVDGVAWHGYYGGAEAMTRVHDAYPDKHAYWTEGGPDISSPDYATDWSKWSMTFTGVLRNWARCIVGWNLALDEKGNPNIGPFPCGGLVTIDSKTQKITRSGQYWAFAHFSKAIRRNAQVLASDGKLDGVHHVALENPDGSRVLILTNAGEARKVSFSVGEAAAAVQLPKDSIATLVW